MMLDVVIDGREWLQNHPAPFGHDEMFKAIVEEAERNGEGMVRIVMEPIHKYASASQRALFHSLCRQLSYLSGMSEEDVKDIAKESAMYLGYPTEWSGLEQDFEGGRPVPMSSTKADVIEYQKLIEAVKQLANHNGYNLEEYHEPRRERETPRKRGRVEH